MRIALFEQEPRICGATIGLMHLKDGFARLGHEVELVSFTKSGKRRKHWGASGATAPLGCGWSVFDVDRVAKHSDAVAVLDEYDLIILTEPKNSRQDKDGAASHTLPLYIQWLRKTKTPWSTQLFGPQYNPKMAPALPDLFDSTSFVGRGITYGRWMDFPATDTTGTLARIEWVTSPMPYTPAAEMTHFDQGLGSVGITGRLTPNKGQQVVAWLPSIDAPWDVQLWGACSVGLGACFSYDIWEKIKQSGAEQIFRDGPRDEAGELKREADGRPKHTPLNPFPWRARWNGREVNYHGNYSGTEPYSTFDVHINLTSPLFSGGLIEFATMEAIGAGKRIVCNANVYDGELHAGVVDMIPKSTIMLGKGRGDEDLRRLQSAIRDSLETTESDLKENLELIRRTNDPAAVATRYLEQVFKA